MLEIVQALGALLRRRRKAPDTSPERHLDHGDLDPVAMLEAPEVSYEDEYGRKVPSSEIWAEDRLEPDGEG
jgi:hypothetical protein